MQYCEKCKVKIRTSHEKCPLCQGIIKGEAEKAEEIFPEIKEKNYPGVLFFQCFTFICIASGVITVMVNRIFTPLLNWHFYVLGGIVCIWICTAVGLLKRRNLLKNAIWQEIIVIIISIGWDIFTGWHKWSLDYVVPCICVVTILFMVVMSVIQKLKPQEYMIYFVIAGGLGMLPIIFLWMGILKIDYPSILCSGFSFLFLIALLLFRYHIVMTELHKKLHI